MSDELSDKYPEHAKLEANRVEVEMIENFLHWLQDEYRVVGIVRHDHLGQANSRGVIPFDDLTDTACRGLIATYYGIDQKALEAEKNRMLMMLRARH